MKYLIKITFITLIVLPLTCSIGFTQDLVITNARILDMAGRDIEQGTLIISGDRIDSVSTEHYSASGASVIDAQGMTVLPGLIDAHVHATLVSQGNKLLIPNDESEVMAAFDGPVRSSLSAYLDEGFTSIMDAGGLWPYVVDLRDRISTGELRGPRMFVSGGIVTAPNGHPATWVCARAMGDFCKNAVNAEARDVSSARALVIKYADNGQGVDQLKIAFDGVIAPPKLDADVVQAIIEEAHQQGIRALGHALDARDVNDMIAWGIDGFVHPPFVPADADKVYFSGFAGRNIALTITFGPRQYMARQAGPENLSAAQQAGFSTIRKNVVLALESGALPVYGSDAPPGMHPALAKKIVIESLLSSGLSNTEVLRAATKNAAILLGRDDLGSLESGNIADILIVDGNPLVDLDSLGRVTVVIKDGVVVKDNRATP